MRHDGVTRRARRESFLAVACLGCLVATGCTAYDRALLGAKVGKPGSGGSGKVAIDAALVDAAGSMRSDAQTDGARMDAGHGGGAGDSGLHADSGEAKADAGRGDASSMMRADASSDAGTCTAATADCCPSDPMKVVPGMCGCGVADTDTDSDGVPDCHDGCPMDNAKVAPGVCGCGFADANDGCLGLRAALLHRYSFGGTGTSATDSKNAANGTVVGTTLDGSGALTFSGTADEYVDLPNNLLSPLTDATLEVWLSWSGGNSWQRIFDFGSTNVAEGMRGTGMTYLFLSPKAGGGTTALHLTFSANGTGNETTAASSSGDLPTSTMVHVVAVVDDTHDQLRLFLDGTMVGTTSFTGHLSQLSDVNAWLGRSLFSADAALGGTIYEFRIYGDALNAAQIAASKQAGPDASFF